MAIRQYVGARYVPKYMGHFDSTLEYEPLSIVDDANGNSYTSKIPVPAGSSLDDTRYWAQTGNFSGAVLQLQTRMTDAEGNIRDLQDDMTTAKENITTAEGDIDALQGAIDALQGDMTTAKENITTAEGNIDALQGAIGALQGEIDNTVDMIHLDPKLDCMMIADSWGVLGLTAAFDSLTSFRNLYNSSKGGSGFIAAGDPPATDQTFAKLYTDLCNTLTQDQLNKVSLLIVAGGVNDAPYLTNLTAAVKSFIDTAKVRTPNAKIHIMCVNNQIRGLWNRFEYVDHIMAATGYKGAAVYDLTRTAKITEYRDNLHLSDYKTIAKNMVAALNGARCGAGYAVKIFDTTIDQLNNTALRFIFYQHNEQIYAYFDGFSYTGSWQSSGLARLTLTVPNMIIPYYNGECLFISMNVKYQGDMAFTAVPAYVRFQESGIDILIFGKQGTTITELYAAPCQMNIQW